MREVVSLASVAEVVGGFAFKSREFGVTGQPVIKIGDIEPPYVNVDRCERVDISAYAPGKLKRYELGEGDCLIAMTGATIGKFGRIRKPFSGFLNQRVAKIAAKPEKANQDFLYYALSGSAFQEFIINAASGSSVQENASAGDIGQFEFLLPPIDEQRAIAEVLSSLDDKIDLLHRQNKTLERLAETLFRQWFIEGAKNDWKEHGLDEIADFLNGLACQKYPPKSGVPSLPVIKIKELRTGITDASDLAATDVPEKYIVADGDILFSWSGSLEVIIWSGGHGVLNQHLFKVTSAEFPQWFYYFWIKHHLEEFRGVAGDKATTMGHIQRHHLSDAKVLVPTKAELVSMNGAIHPLFSKLKANHQHMRKLEKVREALLPKLMSGEVILGGTT